MKIIRFTNESGNMGVELLTDLIGDNDMLTVYEVRNIKDTDISFGIDFEVGEYTLNFIKSFAEENNLTMKIYETGQDVIESKTFTALGVTTAALPNGTASGVQQVETITFPATAAAAQGDYIVLSNTEGKTLAAWLDIDEDGTAPTGVKYTGADYQVKVSIETDGLAIANATTFFALLKKVYAFYFYMTAVDNGDGTVTITQNAAGSITDADPENIDSTGAGSITASVDAEGVGGATQLEVISVPATAAATQGDFIVLYNYTGESLAAWLDIDADGTEPSGTIYSATDYQVKVSIVGGGTAGANGTLLYDAVLAETAWSDFVNIADSESGTVAVTQKEQATVTEAVPKDTTEAGAGSITATTTRLGRYGRYVNIDFTDVQLEHEGGCAPITWTAANLPAGLSVSSTGVVSGTPIAVAATYTVTFTATDFYDVEADEDIDIVLI